MISSPTLKKLKAFIIREWKRGKRKEHLITFVILRHKEVLKLTKTFHPLYSKHFSSPKVLQTFRLNVSSSHICFQI